MGTKIIEAILKEAEQRQTWADGWEDNWADAYHDFWVDESG